MENVSAMALKSDKKSKHSRRSLTQQQIQAQLIHVQRSKLTNLRKKILHHGHA